MMHNMLSKRNLYKFLLQGILLPLKTIAQIFSILAFLKRLFEHSERRTSPSDYYSEGSCYQHSETNLYPKP